MIFVWTCGCRGDLDVAEIIVCEDESHKKLWCDALEIAKERDNFIKTTSELLGKEAADNMNDVITKVFSELENFDK